MVGGLPRFADRAVVGVTCHYDVASWGGWTADAIITHAWYPQRFAEAGFSVLMIPPNPNAMSVIDRLDALVITGGSDVDPRCYGATRNAAVDPPDPERDEAEISLAQLAWERAMPTLGVCRGNQVLAVAMGGTLVQHLPEATSLAHDDQDPGAFVDHEVTLQEGTLIANILGSGPQTVNSAHHQAVADPGRLTATGWASDGMIEVVEDPGREFFLGVQWHPEVPGQWTGPLLFGALEQAATRFRQHR